MEVSDYFIVGKMYAYGGIPNDFRRIYYQKLQTEPRTWFPIEGGVGQEYRYYPKIGQLFMCLAVVPKTFKTSGNEVIEGNIIRFLTPNSKIVRESCNKISKLTFEKWSIAHQHFENRV